MRGSFGKAASRCGRLVSAGAALAVGLASPAAATTIVLSGLSSDSTPASQLDATVSFGVVATTLTVDVLNQSADPAAFNISAIYFNSSADVTDLTFSAGPGSCPGGSGCRWNFFASTGLGGPTAADGFGVFDWAIVSNRMSGNGVISAGSSRSFEFSISGAAPFDMSDFGTELSTVPPGSNPALVAAKFVQCVGAGCVSADDSAFGATVPEPGTAALLLLGLAGLALMARSPR